MTVVASVKLEKRIRAAPWRGSASARPSLKELEARDTPLSGTTATNRAPPGQ